jgi:hypothetical protein
MFLFAFVIPFAIAPITTVNIAFALLITPSDATQMIGLSACGRATIVALKLNRANVVNLRRLLANAQLHPPSW